MKLKFLYLPFFALVLGSFLLSNSAGRAETGWGNTGAPGDQVGCFANSCHVDNSNFGTMSTIEVLDDQGNAITEYSPGEVYQVRLTISTTMGNPGGYGFQIVSLLDSDNSDVAAWSNPGTDVQIMTASNTGRSYAEHTQRSSNNIFTVDWTAPAVNSGSLTFYASGMAVNGNGMFSGDDPSNTTLSLTEGVVSSNKEIEATTSLLISPNPVQNSINLEIETKEAAIYQVEILDFSGRVLEAKVLNLEAGKQQVQYDAQSLESGFYILRLSSENGQLSQSLLKL